MNNIKRLSVHTSEASDNLKNKKHTAQFISLEGSEGAGKTTAMNIIVEQLNKWNVPYIQTREPGGQVTAEKIRALLLHSEHLEAKTELLLMFASRNEHVNKVIKPALAEGCWVVSDRFVDASYAYQGFGRGIGWETIAYLDELVVGNTTPNLTLMLDVDPLIGLERAALRSEKDRIEKEDISFFENIRKGYLKRAKNDLKRVKMIDANQNMTAVKNDILLVLQQFKQTLE